MKLFLGFIAYLALFIAVQAGIPAEEVESMSALMRAMPGLTNPIGEIRWKINHPELACCFRGVICSPAGGLDDCTKPLESNQTIISIETQYFTGGFFARRDWTFEKSGKTLDEAQSPGRNLTSRFVEIE
jgi:hypothetical protein